MQDASGPAVASGLEVPSSSARGCRVVKLPRVLVLESDSSDLLGVLKKLQSSEPFYSISSLLMGFNEI